MRTSPGSCRLDVRVIQRPAAEASPSVALDPTQTLTSLANPGHTIAWGTHQSPGACVAMLSIGPFDADELEVNGMGDRLDAGFIAVRGPVFVAGWYAYTYGADYLHGELATPRLDVARCRRSVLTASRAQVRFHAATNAAPRGFPAWDASAAGVRPSSSLAEGSAPSSRRRRAIDSLSVAT